MKALNKEKKSGPPCEQDDPKSLGKEKKHGGKGTIELKRETTTSLSNVSSGRGSEKSTYVQTYTIRPKKNLVGEYAGKGKRGRGI